MKILHIRALIVIGAALILMIGGAVAYAQIPSADGTITGCYMKSGGSIRIIDTGASCKSSETKLTWNQKGQPGTNGTNGTPGTNGTNGVSGWEIVTRSDDDGDIANIKSLGTIIVCPTGKKVTGGGGSASVTTAAGGSRFPALLESEPGNEGRSWNVAWGMGNDGAFATGDTLHYNIYAVCSTVTP
jgi:hypothetical protein